MLTITYRCQTVGLKDPDYIGRDLPQLGMEVFHGRNGNSGISVVVSIGAHCHPGRRFCSAKERSQLLGFSENLYLDYVGGALCQDSGDRCPTLQGDCIHVKDKTLKMCKVIKVRVRRMEYLVSCNMQRSRHQFRQAQTCREGPDKGKIKYPVSDPPCRSLWRGSILWEIRLVQLESDCRLFGSHT